MRVRTYVGEVPRHEQLKMEHENSGGDLLAGSPFLVRLISVFAFALVSTTLGLAWPTRGRRPSGSHIPKADAFHDLLSSTSSRIFLSSLVPKEQSPAPPGTYLVLEAQQGLVGLDGRSMAEYGREPQVEPSWCSGESTCARLS